VGGERLEVRLDSGASFDDAVDALVPMSDERPVCEDGLLKLTVRRRAGAIVEAVRRLSDAGVGVDDLSLRRPTLDDVFLALTGHAAEDGSFDGFSDGSSSGVGGGSVDGRGSVGIPRGGGASLGRSGGDGT
jgi:ABC-2 type transport system ATP-binding protein